MQWKPDYWYAEPQPEMLHIPITSDELESAWASVGNVFLEHQYAWDDADFAFADESFVESEPEPDSDGEIEDNDDL